MPNQAGWGGVYAAGSPPSARLNRHSTPCCRVLRRPKVGLQRGVGLPGWQRYLVAMALRCHGYGAKPLAVRNNKHRIQVDRATYNSAARLNNKATRGRVRRQVSVNGRRHNGHYRRCNKALATITSLPEASGGMKANTTKYCRLWFKRWISPSCPPNGQFQFQE